jgi:hypothetical protein
MRLMLLRAVMDKNSSLICLKSAARDGKSEGQTKTGTGHHPVPVFQVRTWGGGTPVSTIVAH